MGRKYCLLWIFMLLFTTWYASFVLLKYILINAAAKQQQHDFKCLGYIWQEVRICPIDQGSPTRALSPLELGHRSGGWACMSSGQVHAQTLHLPEWWVGVPATCANRTVCSALACCLHRTIPSPPNQAGPQNSAIDVSAAHKLQPYTG